MDPQIWGPVLWTILEYTAARARSAYYRPLFLEFLYTLKHIIPCEKCRNSYNILTRFLPPEDFASNEIRWVWFLHDTINDKLGKKKYPFDKLLANLPTRAKAIRSASQWYTWAKTGTLTRFPNGSTDRERVLPRHIKLLELLFK